MKKLVILSALTLCCSLMAYAKKKQNNVRKDLPKEVAEPIIQTFADSLSYSFGYVVMNELQHGLVLMGLLTDTTTIISDYQFKMYDDNVDKTALEVELQARVDSVKAANNTNKVKFLDGFKDAFLRDEGDIAYKTGVVFAKQVEKLTFDGSRNVFSDKNSFNKELFISAITSALQNEQPIIANVNEIFRSSLLYIAEEENESEDKDKLRTEYADRIKEGEEFLAVNKLRKEVTALPSGLQYEILKKGEGKTPDYGDKVQIFYQGKLLDGTVVDSNLGETPREFYVGQLIDGWNEALTMMPKGSKWILYIPYNLAYEEDDMGLIKPFSTLIFEVELVDFIEADEND